jgi:dimeric dUTPase (all-alpha-NTP-PPase superfamily)
MDVGELFEIQNNLVDALSFIDSDIPAERPVNVLTKAGQRTLRDVGLKAIEELHEALRHFKNWKPHRHTDVSDFDRAKFLEEMADSLAFQLELLILLGVSADEFIDAYTSKINIVYERINNGY